MTTTPITSTASKVSGLGSMQLAQVVPASKSLLLPKKLAQVQKPHEFATHGAFVWPEHLWSAPFYHQVLNLVKWKTLHLTLNRSRFHTQKKPPIVEIGGFFVDYVQLSRFRVRLLQFLFD